LFVGRIQGERLTLSMHDEHRMTLKLTGLPGHVNSSHQLVSLSCPLS